ncbi:BA14K family protein [Rhizobium halophytocola]|uniref:Lectin-like protein BA14k n=2 Tax=Rhizobium halophytocola TaxID=735519 RepID=A0ABS4E1I8_9HYPH|nr:hypothetical protein [Rhizobium halophytocola]
MNRISKGLIGLVFGLASFEPAIATAAMPVTAIEGASRSDMVDARIVCGPRGCFDTRHRHRPRHYDRHRHRRDHYRPAPPPRHYGRSAHIRWCLGRYRSYSPATDRYKGYDGRYHRCYSPYR